jgi:hypothetical protein
MSMTPAERADALFKRGEEAKTAWSEHVARTLATREKTARLRALRLTRKAEEKNRPPQSIIRSGRRSAVAAQG